MTAVGRLAPTPSGDLHLGNACAFGAAWLSARAAGGRVLLRLEDVDRGRARTDVAARQRADLRWLGLDWDEETPRQALRHYAPFLHTLGASLYRCTCSRRQVREAGGVYPGTCRDAGHHDGAVRLRLPAGAVHVADRRFAPRDIDPAQTGGDPLLRRADGVYTYTLAVVADDLVDGVTEVVRGADLLDYTATQILVWQALGATPPSWLHAPLVLGPDGRKLSKSHASTELRTLRGLGWTAADVWRVVLPWLGLAGDRIADAVSRFDPGAGPLGPIRLAEDPRDCPPGGLRYLA